MKIYNKKKLLTKQKPMKAERDEQIGLQAKAYSLEFMAAATQILTIICLIKRNPAWKGSLSLLFFGVAYALFYKHKQYSEKPYQQAGTVFLAIGIVLLVWFGIME